MSETTWSADSRFKSYPKLRHSAKADIAIIGGGITGITLAYLLRKSRKSIVLLEKNSLCSDATGATTAFLTQSVDTDYSKLVKMFGDSGAKIIADSHGFAIDQIEKIIKKERIDCEFKRCSNYSYALDDKEADSLRAEEKISKKLGIKSKFDKMELGFDNSGYLEYDEQAKFHPLKYLSALSRIASKSGVKIYENTEVKYLEKTKDDKIHFITENGVLIADKVIVATHSPFNKKLFFKKAVYKSFIFELRIPARSIPEGIYEDTLDPYHYFRIDAKKGFDRLVIGGEDHRSDIHVNEKKNFKALKDYMDKRFRFKYKIVRSWYGPIIEPVDGIAYIGNPDKDNIWYATGFSGNGMTYGTLSAFIITDDILKNKNAKLKRFSSIYSADRKARLKNLAYKGADFSRELVKGALKNTLKYKIRSKKV